MKGIEGLMLALERIVPLNSNILTRKRAATKKTAKRRTKSGSGKVGTGDSMAQESPTLKKQNRGDS